MLERVTVCMGVSLGRNFIVVQISNHTLCLAWEVGWQPRPVKRIPPPGYVLKNFKDQFTKLRIWELEEFERVVYMDSDMLVMGDINELFDIQHFDFAAVGWCGPHTHTHTHKRARTR